MISGYQCMVWYNTAEQVTVPDGAISRMTKSCLVCAPLSAKMLGYQLLSGVPTPKED
jgi:hypothetical protein